MASLTVLAVAWLKSSGVVVFFGTCAGRRSDLLSSSSACRCALSAFVRFVAIPTASHNRANLARPCGFQTAPLPNCWRKRGYFANDGGTSPLGRAGCGFGSAGWLVHWDSAVFVDGELAEGLVQFAAFADSRQRSLLVQALDCELRGELARRGLPASRGSARGSRTGRGFSSRCAWRSSLVGMVLGGAGAWVRYPIQLVSEQPQTAPPRFLSHNSEHVIGTSK